MGFVSKINTTVDYGINSFTEEVVTQPSTLKQIFDLADKASAGIDYYTGHSNCPELTEAVKGVISFLGFYDLYKGLISWKNPFNVKNIDQGILTKILSESIREQKKDEKNIDALVSSVVHSVLQKNYRTKKQFIKELKVTLITLSGKKTEEFSDVVAEKIVGNVNDNVHVKPRTKYEMMVAFCKTTWYAKASVESFDRMKIIDCAHLSAQLGQKAPVFLFILRGAVYLAHKGFMVINALGVFWAVRDIIRAQKMINASTSVEEKNAAYIHRKKALWDLASSATKLAQLVIPFIFVVATPTLLILGIIAGGTATLKIFAKPS